MPKRPQPGSGRHQDRRTLERVESRINAILDSEIPTLVGEITQLAKLPVYMQEYITRKGDKYIKRTRLVDAVAAAEHGDMRPARAIVSAAVRYWLTRSPDPLPEDRDIPDLSRFLQPPKRRGKGNRFRKNAADKARDVAYDEHLIALGLAVKDAARIREIAQEHNLPRLTGEFSPMAIAARRHGVPELQALKWQKSKLRPRSSAK
jgi:hypothetical protein